MLTKAQGLVRLVDAVLAKATGRADARSEKRLVYLHLRDRSGHA